ncbi:MAG: AAA family ATPase [Pseudomonadota bacterium]|nr:AAA family ATPase [Pseudomonadota bacterium]
MLVSRDINLLHLLASKSHFLFGARLTGKSTLVDQQLAGTAKIIDLLNPEIFLRASTAPTWFERVIRHSGKQIVVVDEIQRLPELLNSVQRLITSHGIRFLLTGSSVRKLRRGGANFLGGRARTAHLFPLTSSEIPKFNLTRYLHFGGLPSVYLSQNPSGELADYVFSYMRDEVQAEGLVRNLPPFTRFLQTMALANGELLNFTNMANDCHVAVKSVRSYVQILEDTMFGALLLPWRASQRRKAIATAKFYFFDTGVARVLSGIKKIERHSNLYGKSFEHFIWMELRAYLSYRSKQLTELTFWRSRQGHEVDFLVGEELAIEVKASSSVSPRDLKGLRMLADEGIFKKFYLVSQDRNAQKHGIFTLVHWQSFLTELWSDKLLS